MDSKHLTGKPDADAVNITPLAHEAVIDAPLIGRCGMFG